MFKSWQLQSFSTGAETRIAIELAYKQVEKTIANYYQPQQSDEGFKRQLITESVDKHFTNKLDLKKPDTIRR